MRLLKQHDASDRDPFFCDECRMVTGELIEFDGGGHIPTWVCINCLGKAVELFAVTVEPVQPANDIDFVGAKENGIRETNERFNPNSIMDDKARNRRIAARRTK